MKCPSNTSMYRDITERKSDNIFFNACLYVCGKYKEPVALISIKTLRFMILGRETIVSELLLTEVTRQPLFSFTLWKTELRREMQWNYILGKAWPDCFLSRSRLYLICSHESELIFAFPLLTSRYGLFVRLLFCDRPTRETSVCSK